MFITRLRVKKLTHNFLDKLEMTMHAVISSLQCHLVKKPSHIFRQAQYDQRAVSQSLSKTVG